MKQFLILVLTLLACACTKTSKEASYTFIDAYGSIEHVSQVESLKDGNISMTVTINEYQGDRCVATNTINAPQKGIRYSFTAKNGAEYVKVLVHLTACPSVAPTLPMYELKGWFKEVILLTPGANTDITFYGNTRLTEDEPSR